MDIHKTAAQKIAVYKAGAGCNTSAVIAEEVASLVKSGVAPQEILVLSASPDAAAVMERVVLAAAAEQGVDARGIQVTTARQYALAMLQDERVKELLGRDGNVLAPHDFSVLMEDIKVNGQKVKQLRGMLKFFFRGLTELSDHDPEWLRTQDEADTFQQLSRLLRFNGGVLEYEITNLGWCALNDEAIAGAYGKSYVLVDDFQNMNRSSQAMAAMLAGHSLVVAVKSACASEVYDPYPYEEGLDELLALNPGSVVIELEGSESAGQLGAAMRNLEAEAAGEGMSPFMDEWLPAVEKPVMDETLRVERLESPQDEAARVADLVASAIEGGLKPSEVFVISPNVAWDRRIAFALMDKGITAIKKPAARGLRGDVRDLKTCVDSQIYTALQLVADDMCRLAWRTWCGYGDWLACSTGFSQLRDIAQEGGADLVNTLEYLHRNPNVQLFDRERIMKAYQHGRSVIEAASGLTGKELLDAVVAAVTNGNITETPATALALFRPEEADTAAVMVERAKTVLFEAAFSDREDAVRIGRKEDSFKAGAKRLVWTGFVNGFIPEHGYFDNTVTSDISQRRIFKRGVRSVIAALEGVQSATFTFPRYMDALEGAKLNAHADRIRMLEGSKVYQLAPCEFTKLLVRE